MDNKILEIKNQRYSTFIANFFMCEYCHYVDCNWNRMMVGFKCKVCSKPSDGAIIYFSSSVTSLLNLIQESYHSKFYISESKEENSFEESAKSHYLSVVIYFCTLREVLLQKFLDEMCLLHKIPTLVYERLLADNQMYSQKQNKLFYSMLNIKWEDAIKEANTKDDLDYIYLNTLLKKAVDCRNEFLHKGRDYFIDRKLAEECIMNLWTLLNLYVRFHNDFVHPYYLSKCT
ncbi:MAG: hypothetical protein A2080_10885 [Ignavibacteria bacterium GWC2_36_12]|nr:MAG: hypothetical protein A2080_10885 [Ignavibacteria bacterium GWC2_36_12]